MSENLNTLVSIASIIEVFVVMLSVVIILYEVHQNSNLGRANNVQSIAELSSTFNIQLITDRSFAEMWVNGHNR